jgi:RHS repeat-associated protein
VFSIGYDFHVGNGTSGADNGNVFGITNYKDATRNQTFTYDLLNRLASAQNAGTDCNATVLGGNKKFWGNTYSYDAWGNLVNKTKIGTACAGENLSVTADAHNWIHATGGADYQYDAAGNMTFNATPPTQTYTYDQENRLTGAAGYTYTYDGDGNRVRKSNASAGTLYWYMTPGVVAETDLAGTTRSEYIFFDGERVARRDGATGTGGVFYYFSDNLKTASIITDSAGVIKAESDYYPWGGELQFVNNDSNDYKFTGKKRDVETGLDYFGARYYSNGLGRWISADWATKATTVPYAEFADPQSLNLYNYVRSIPTSHLDIDGHEWKLWEDVKKGLSQISVKATFGVGIGGKAGGEATAGLSGRAELAIKGNVEFSGPEGRVKASTSVEGGASLGVGNKQVGLAGSVEQVHGSVDVKTGELHGQEPPTAEKVVGLSKGDNSVNAGKENVVLFGAEGGEGAIGGGEISISKEGLAAFKEAASDVKEMLSPTPPPPPPPPSARTEKIK